VFGYGSLAAESARERVVELAGWRREWGVAMDNRRDLPGYKYYTDAEGNRPPVRVVFPDIRPASGEIVIGVLRAVDPGDLVALDRRERNYERTEVTESIAGRVDGRVWAYVGSEPARLRFAEGMRARREGREDGAAVIHAEYLESVLSAFARLGEEAGNECRRSLAPGVLPMRQLVRHDLPDRPRAWRSRPGQSGR
jgi:hypothetical protein